MRTTLDEAKQPWTGAMPFEVRRWLPEGHVKDVKEGCLTLKYAEFAGSLRRSLVHNLHHLAGVLTSEEVWVVPLSGHTKLPDFFWIRVPQRQSTSQESTGIPIGRTGEVLFTYRNGYLHRCLHSR